MRGDERGAPNKGGGETRKRRNGIKGRRREMRERRQRRFKTKL
jgi:hypothetical protein